jgi:hypothetical protein
VLASYSRSAGAGKIRDANQDGYARRGKAGNAQPLGTIPITYHSARLPDSACTVPSAHKCTISAGAGNAHLAPINMATNGRAKRALHSPLTAPPITPQCQKSDTTILLERHGLVLVSKPNHAQNTGRFASQSMRSTQTSNVVQYTANTSVAVHGCWQKSPRSAKH